MTPAQPPRAMPRVAMVSPRYAPAIGGVETHVERLTRGLTERGWRVEVVTTDPPGTATPRAERDGVPVLRFPTLLRDATFYLAPRLGWWLLRRGRRYDLIHAHSYHTPVALLAALAAAFHRRPLVLTPHYHGTGHTPLRQRLHRPYRLPGGWMVRRSALVICSSEAERFLVHRDFGAAIPTMVVPHGVDVAGFMTAAPFEGLPGVTILAGGRLEGYKQVDRVIEAMAVLPVDHHLYVFGEGPERGALERLASASPAAGRIRFLGRVAQDALHRWARSADVFVSLSLEEAYGLSTIETAAAGAAQVLSDIPAYLEMAERLEGHPVEVVPRDADASTVATAIRSAAAARGTHPTVGPAFAAPTWDAMTDEIAAGYRQVLGRGTPAEVRTP